MKEDSNEQEIEGETELLPVKSFPIEVKVEITERTPSEITIDETTGMHIDKSIMQSDYSHEFLTDNDDLNSTNLTQDANQNKCSFFSIIIFKLRKLFTIIARMNFLISFLTVIPSIFSLILASVKTHYLYPFSLVCCFLFIFTFFFRAYFIYKQQYDSSELLNYLIIGTDLFFILFYNIIVPDYFNSLKNYFGVIIIAIFTLSMFLMIFLVKYKKSTKLLFILLGLITFVSLSLYFYAYFTWVSGLYGLFMIFYLFTCYIFYIRTQKHLLFADPFHYGIFLLHFYLVHYGVIDLKFIKLKSG